MIKVRQYLSETSSFVLIILIIFKKENIKLLSEIFQEKKDIILYAFYTYYRLLQLLYNYYRMKLSNFIAL